MESTRGSIQELRPHATWWAIEFTGHKLFEKLAEAGLVAFAIGIITWLKSHLDAVTVIGGFITSMLILAWASRSRAATPKTDEKEVTGSVREFGDLHAEIARLNQHRIDLLGTSGQKENEHVSLIKEIARIQHQFDQSDKALTQRIATDGPRANIRRFKAMARQIRRTWPESDFVKRPLYKNSWMPTVDAAGSCPWLQLANDWIEAAYKLESISNIAGLQAQSMDFDEVMEVLDDAERILDGGNAFTLDQRCPRVEIVGWGTRDTSEQHRNHFGLFIRNQGGPAHQVSVFPAVQIGDYSLSSDSVPVLHAEHANVFLPTRLSDKKGVLYTPMTLAKTIREEFPRNSNGFRVAPLIRLVYQTQNGSWIGSTHQIQASPDGLSVYICLAKRELLLQHSTLPSLRAASSQ